MAVTSLHAPRAEALDLTFYIAATVNSSQAGAYRRDGNDEDADRARQRGSLFLGLGLLCSVAGVVLYAASADRVERLDTEVSHGGGPITEAYAAAFGLTTAEVVASARESVAGYGVGGGTETVDEALVGRLLSRARFTDETAARLLYAFYEERGRLGSGNTPWHDSLSKLAGVPVEELATTIAAPIDARLMDAIVPGTIVSARSALASDATTTLQAVLDRVYDQHTAAVEAQIRAAAAGPTAEPAAG